MQNFLWWMLLLKKYKKKLFYPLSDHFEIWVQKPPMVWRVNDTSLELDVEGESSLILGAVGELATKTNTNICYNLAAESTTGCNLARLLCFTEYVRLLIFVFYCRLYFYFVCLFSDYQYTFLIINIPIYI